MPAVEVHAPICAERKYNVVEIGDKTREVIKLQEDARLWFDAAVFWVDYRATWREWKQVRHYIKAKFPTRTRWRDQSEEERRLRITEVKLQAFVWEHRSIYEQVLPIVRRVHRWARTRPLVGPRPPELVRIRSAFYKVLNRRYQPAHFWPMQVSGKQDATYPLPVSVVPEEMRSRRARWFRVPDPRLDPTDISPWRRGRFQPLVSMDISASQTQLQAVLLGLDDMEQDAVLSRRPHKEALAERAWAAHEAEQPSVRTEADREKALKIETRRYRIECKKVRTDLVENHAAALAVMEKHKTLVANIEAKLNAIASPYGPLLIGYKNAQDPRLVEMMKNLWMILGYGETINGILRKQARDPDRYGAIGSQVSSKATDCQAIAVEMVSGTYPFGQPLPHGGC
jgi:hypothetical protein